MIGCPYTTVSGDVFQTDRRCGTLILSELMCACRWGWLAALHMVATLLENLEKSWN